MNARILLAAPAVALAFAAAPAAAKPDNATSRMAEKMNDPETQRAMATAVAAASEAILDIPLEPLARAAEAMGDRRTARRMRGSTLRDVAGPEAEDMPRELAHKLPAMMGAMGGMAVAMEEMAPALKAMAKEMGARMSDAMRRGADARDDRADPRDDAPPPSAQEESGEGPYAEPAEGEDPGL
jgi:hypothetical protein